MEIILNLFEVNEHLTKIDTYHLSPDSNCYLFRNKKGDKYALFETDYPSGASYDKVNIESIGVNFRKWVKPKKIAISEEELKVFVFYEGLKYALALIE